MKIQAWRWASLALLLLVPAAGAQEKEKTESPAPAESHTRFTPLRVQVVFSKYQGDRKVASLPYTLTCNAGERAAAVLRMGIEVPITVATVKDSASQAIQQFQYKNVGTNIDCRAGQPEDGRYRLELNVEQTSIYSPGEEKVTPVGKEKDREGKVSWGVSDTPMSGAPAFRSFRAQFVPFLRDGQTLQYTAATDPVSGEVVKIDVTVTVVK
jgi:phage gp46-like protein